MEMWVRRLGSSSGCTMSGRGETPSSIRAEPILQMVSSIQAFGIASQTFSDPLLAAPLITTQLAQVYKELDLVKESNFTLQSKKTTLRNATALLPPAAPALHPSTPFPVPNAPAPNTPLPVVFPDSPATSRVDHPATPVSALCPIVTAHPPSVSPSTASTLALGASGIIHSLVGQAARAGEGRLDKVKEALAVYEAATGIHVGLGT